MILPFRTSCHKHQFESPCIKDERGVESFLQAGGVRGGGWGMQGKETNFHDLQMVLNMIVPFRIAMWRGVHMLSSSSLKSKGVPSLS